MTALTGVGAGRRIVTHAGVLGRLPSEERVPSLEPAEAAALSALLEEIPSAAFVVWADGRIACANLCLPETSSVRKALSGCALRGKRPRVWNLIRVMLGTGNSSFQTTGELALENQAVVREKRGSPRDAEGLRITRLCET